MANVGKLIAKGALVSLIVGLGGFTYVYFKKQMELLKGTLYEVAGVDIKELSFKKISFVLYYKIMNKSDISIKINGSDLRLFLGGMEIAHSVITKPKTLKPKRCVTFQIPVSISIKKLLSFGVDNINTLLYNKEKVTIDVKGKISIGTSLFKLKAFPVDYSESLSSLVASFKQVEEDTGKIEETIGNDYLCD